MFRCAAPLVFLRRLLPGLVAAFALALAACGSGTKPKTGAPLAEADRAVMKQYDEVRMGLASDDLRHVRLAAEKMRKALEAPGVSAQWDAKALAAAKGLEQISRLDAARTAFRDVSLAAIAVCGDVEGYYVFDGGFTASSEWVQSSKEPGNPYAGRAMAGYGEIKNYAA